MAQTAVLDDKPLWMQPVDGDSNYPDGIQYLAQQIRRQEHPRTVYAEGVLGKFALRVHERDAGANFTVEVDPGPYAVQGDDVADQGMYRGHSPTKKSLDVPPAPSSGTVTHRVVCRVRDRLHDGTWSDYDAAVQLLEDTGSGTPPVPPTAFNLATIAVSSTTSAITNSEITYNPPRGDQHGANHRFTGIDPGPHDGELIEHTVLTSNTVPINFDNVPQHYNHLEITMTMRLPTAAASTVMSLWLRFNFDNGNNYDSFWKTFRGDGTDAGVPNIGTSTLYWGRAGDLSSSATIVINGYTSSNIYKSVHTFGTALGSSSEGDIEIFRGGGRWRSNAAVTSVQLHVDGGENFESGSVFSLRGKL